MKKRIFYLLAILCFGAYFASQILTASAGPAPKFIVGDAIFCEPNSVSAEGGGDIYFADQGECLSELGPQADESERIPTAIKLISTGTELRDPISTAGIVMIFFALVVLTLLWMAMIRNWNRFAEDE